MELHLGSDRTREPPETLAEALGKAIERDDIEEVVRLAWYSFYSELAGMALYGGVDDSEVDDVIQHVYSRVIEGWSRFNRGNMRGWVREITRYEILTWRACRRRSREVPAGEQSESPSAEGGSAWLETRSEVARVLAVVEKLDVMSKAVFEATFVRGLRDHEAAKAIAVATGVVLSPDAVRARKSRLRVLVLQALEVEDG